MKYVPVPCQYCGRITERATHIQKATCFLCKIQQRHVRTMKVIENVKKNCQHCGQEMPHWKMKYCSDECSRNRNKITAHGSYDVKDDVHTLS